MSEQDTVFVGIDWASEKHDVCVIDGSGSVVGERQFQHSGEGLTELTQWLSDCAEGSLERVRVAIEVTHGPVVETLIDGGIAVFSINPKQLDRFRDRFTVAGAKDDRLDARVLADSLRTDGHLFRAVKPAAGELVELREWSRMAEELNKEQVRLGRQMSAQLARYYPQMLELASNIADPWILELWKLIPAPDKARRKRRKTIEQLLRKHLIRRIDADAVLDVLRKRPVTVAAGTVEAATAHIKLLIERLTVVNRQLKRAHRELDKRLGEVGAPTEEGPGQRVEQRDVEILRSLPGVGRIVLATLLCEATEAIAQRDYQVLRALAGVAPVTRRSGKSILVVRRQACHSRIREAVYHWSRVAAQRDNLCKAKYAALRARGCSHGRALRTVGDRLLAVACAMLRNQTDYLPAKAKAA